MYLRLQSVQTGSGTQQASHSIATGSSFPLAAAWPACRLCYRPAVFFCLLHLIVMLSPEQKLRRAFQICYYFNFYNFVKLRLHDLNLRKPGIACTLNLFEYYFGQCSLPKIVSKQIVFPSSCQIFIHSVGTITFSWSIVTDSDINCGQNVQIVYTEQE